MSCNITNWKTKEIDGFTIPVDSLFECERCDWHPGRINDDDGKTVWFASGESHLKGEIHGDDYLISKILIYSEGSGTLWDLVFKPAFQKGKGKLRAAMIWETGEVERVSFVDGEYTQETVEL